MTKDEILIPVLSMCCASLLVFTLYFATSKAAVKVELTNCQALLIREAHDHTHQLNRLVAQLNFCMELHNEP